MINDKTLALLRRGAIYINTSRGGVQSEPALFQALVTGQLAAAGIDVFEQEPSPVDNPIFNLDNVVCSGHVAGVTLEANRKASLQVTAEMLRVLRGERPEVLANPEVWPRPAHRR
jgi:D-3-phosphoglycerate dehydrogenase